MSHFSTGQGNFVDQPLLVSALQGLGLKVESHPIDKPVKMSEGYDDREMPPCQIICRMSKNSGLRWNDIGFAWDGTEGRFVPYVDEAGASAYRQGCESFGQRLGAEYAALAAEASGFKVNRDQILKGKLILTKESQKALTRY